MRHRRASIEPASPSYGVVTRAAHLNWRRRPASAVAVPIAADLAGS